MNWLRVLDNKNTTLDTLFSMYVISDIDDLKAFEFLDKGRLFSTDGNINLDYKTGRYHLILLNNLDI